MLQNAFLCILGIMVGCLALLWVVSVLLKGATQKFLMKFGPKKTTVAAIMALIFLPIATAHAGETIVQIEDGNLVYYEKTKTKVIPNVPKGITAEQARQLVEEGVPAVKLSAEKGGYRFGLPITTIKTDTTVFFRGGWTTEEVSNESLSVSSLFILTIMLIYCFYAEYLGNEAIFFIETGFSILAVVAVLLWDTAFAQGVGELGILSFTCYFLGRYLHRRKEKRHAMNVLAVET